jgi:hypothetical protein
MEALNQKQQPPRKPQRSLTRLRTGSAQLRGVPQSQWSHGTNLLPVRPRSQCHHDGQPGYMLALVQRGACLLQKTRQTSQWTRLMSSPWRPRGYDKPPLGCCTTITGLRSAESNTADNLCKALFLGPGTGYPGTKPGRPTGQTGLGQSSGQRRIRGRNRPEHSSGLCGPSLGVSGREDHRAVSYNAVQAVRASTSMRLFSLELRYAADASSSSEASLAENGWSEHAQKGEIQGPDTDYKLHKHGN